MAQDVRNCPNCGAVVNDCVCAYCGTVFQNPLDDFLGLSAMLAAVKDDGTVIAMALKVRSLEQSQRPDFFYTDDSIYRVYSDFPEVSLTGTLGDSATLGHTLRKVGKIAAERLHAEGAE